MKRLIALLAVICLAAGVFAACSQEEEAPEVTPGPAIIVDTDDAGLPDIELEYDADKYVMHGVTLVAYIGDEEAPEIPEGTMVIAPNAFKDCKTVKTVKLRDTLTAIGEYAFSGCDSLEEISVPKMVKSVGKSCFEGCASLKKCEMKTNTTYVGEDCFRGCASLETVTLSSSLTEIKEGLFRDCASLTHVKLTAATSIAAYVFYGCKNLLSVDAPACASIGDFAFFGCEAFGSDEKSPAGGTFSTAVTAIGEHVFDGTYWLDSKKAAAKAPQKASDAYVLIGKGVLVYYSGILPEGTDDPAGTVKFDTKTKNIGPEALQDLRDSVETVEIPSTVIRIEKGAFKDFTKLKEVKIPNSLTVISESAFENCKSLTTVILAGKTTEIGPFAFRGCESLEFFGEKNAAGGKTSAASTEIPADNTDAPAGADGEVPASTEEPDATGTPEVPEGSPEPEPAKQEGGIVIPSTVVSIGDGAFAGCQKITGVTLGNNVEFVGKEAFAGCTAVETVAVNKKLSKVGINAFSGTHWFEDWNGADDGGKLFVIGDGVLIKAIDGAISYISSADAAAPATGDAGETDDGSETAENAVPKIKSISIDLGGIDGLAEKQFYNNKALYSAVIPGNIEKIGDYAFFYADGLFEVIIEEGVKEIGASAFYGCGSLERIVLPSTIEKIGDYAFYGCSGIKSIVIPDTVSSVGKMAFYNCIGLSEVTVPDTVSEIGAFAFTNTTWLDRSTAKYLTAGEGILLKYYAFEKETGITDADGIRAICGGAFTGTYRLEKLTLPASFTELMPYALNGSTSLKEIDAPGVAYVGERAFNFCDHLEKVSFAAGWTHAEDAFNGCELLKIE
ncbi:MAG: leucine-rich repeat domain-containing protein [Clostridia bacterium]|nr:leucine-rich repeat domain-containing protein [Clostridia bacterium]